MAENLIGVVVSSESVDAVVLQRSGTPPFTLQAETSFKLQTGDRAQAYRVLHDQFVNFVKRHHATHVCLKKSALNVVGMKMVHLEAAELRGVVQCAAITGGAEVKLFNRASASRASGRAGGRDVKAYLKDDTHWDSLGLKKLLKGRREAAFAVVEEFSP